MLLLIKNLPSTTRYSELKSMFKNDCHLPPHILDSLEPDVTEGNRTITKRVTLGIADEEDKAMVLMRLDGHYMGGNRLIIEEVKKTPKTQEHSKRPIDNPKNFNNLPKQNNNQPMYGHSSHSQSYGLSSYNRVDYDKNQMHEQKPLGSFRQKFNSPGKNNQNQGNYNHRPENYNQGLENYNRRPGNYDQGPENYNQRPENYNQAQDNYNQGEGRYDQKFNPGSGGNPGNGSKFKFGNPIIKNSDFIKLYDPPSAETAKPLRQSAYGRAQQRTEHDHPQHSRNVPSLLDMPQRGRYFDRGYDQAYIESQDWNKSQFPQMEQHHNPVLLREANKGYHSLSDLNKDHQSEYNRSPKPRSSYGSERWNSDEQRGNCNISKIYRESNNANEPALIWNKREPLDTQPREPKLNRTENPVINMDTPTWGMSVEPSFHLGRGEPLSHDRYDRDQSFNAFCERSPNRKTNIVYSEQQYARSSDTSMAYAEPNHYGNQTQQNSNYYVKQLMELDIPNPKSRGNNQYQSRLYTRNQGNDRGGNEQGRPSKRKLNDRSQSPRGFQRIKLLNQNCNEPPMKKVADGKGYSHSKGGPPTHVGNTRGGIHRNVGVQNEQSPNEQSPNEQINDKNFPRPQPTDTRNFGQPKSNNADSFRQPKPGNTQNFKQEKLGSINNLGHPKPVNVNTKHFAYPIPNNTRVPPPPKPNVVPQFTKLGTKNKNPLGKLHWMLNKNTCARSHATWSIVTEIMKKYNISFEDKKNKKIKKQLKDAVRKRMDKLLGNKIHYSGRVIINLYRGKYDLEEDANIINAFKRKSAGTFIEDISTPNKGIAQAQSSTKNVLARTLSEVQKNALDEELVHCVNLFKEGFDNTEDQWDVALKNIAMRTDNVQRFKNMLRDAIKNRMLNVTRHSLLCVTSIGKMPKITDLVNLLKNYEIQYIKKSVIMDAYIVKCSSFSSFDRLCNMATANVGGIKVDFEPLHIGGGAWNLSALISEQRADFIRRQENFNEAKGEVTKKVDKIDKDEAFEHYALENDLKGDIQLDDDIMQQEFGIKNENQVKEEKLETNAIEKGKNIEVKVQRVEDVTEDVPSDDLTVNDLDSAEVIDEWRDAWSDVDKLDLDDNIDINEEDLEDY